jgi:hypothetical protein
MLPIKAEGMAPLRPTRKCLMVLDGLAVVTAGILDVKITDGYGVITPAPQFAGGLACFTIYRADGPVFGSA